MGKTSLRSRYLGRGFQSEYLPTLGSDFVTKKTAIKVGSESKEIRFQIWDLASQPTFSEVRTLYFKHAVGSLLIFDITSPQTLYNLQRWLDELNQHSGSTGMVIIVLGNKLDLRDVGTHNINEKEAQEFINDKLTNKFKNIDNKIQFLETSAKTGVNVDKAFTELGLRIYSKYYS